MPAQDVLLPLLQNQQPNLFESLMPFVLIFFIFYFLVIRPQNKERKLQQKMRDQLEKGQKVITQAGIIATVSAVRDDEIVLQLDGAKVTVMRESIVRHLDGGNADQKKG